jgi:hypothetical protein
MSEKSCPEVDFLDSPLVSLTVTRLESSAEERPVRPSLGLTVTFRFLSRVLLHPCNNHRSPLG